MRLQKIIQLKGTIKLTSNLHIGSGNIEMHIGGVDNPVIKHPHTLEPFIPGSSIKGKLRSIMELSSGLASVATTKNNNSGGIVSFSLLKELTNPEQKKEAEGILKIFGFSGSDKSGNDNDAQIAKNIGPTRAAFSDCYLNNEWLNAARDNMWPLTVEKAETAIDRISGTAKRGSLRQTEIVPEGTLFDFRLSFKIFDDSDMLLFEKLRKALLLLEADAIGGNVSRGYGRIMFDLSEPQELSCQ